MAPDCANAKILALQMAQIFSVRDDFNFAQLTLMGKDTQTVLWFISETIYQSCFLQKYLRSNKNSQDSCSHSAIYNPFTRRLGFVLFFPTVAFCRTGRKTAMSAPSYSYSAHAPSLRFSLLVFLAPAIHPSHHFLLPDSLARVSGRTNTAPPTPAPAQTRSLTTQALNSPPRFEWGGHLTPVSLDNRTGEGESPDTQRSVWGADLVAHFTLFVLSPLNCREMTQHTHQWSCDLSVATVMLPLCPRISIQQTLWHTKRSRHPRWLGSQTSFAERLNFAMTLGCAFYRIECDAQMLILLALWQRRRAMNAAANC